jgi:hypothetical protein
MGACVSCMTCGLCGGGPAPSESAKGKKKSKKKLKPADFDECAVMRSFCCCCACFCQEKERPENYVSRVFNTSLIGYDQYGNLRYGMGEHDRNSELAEVMALDSTNKDVTDVWHIMDACWVNEWLLYVHSDPNVAPLPGPCYNHRLVRQDDDGNWVPKLNLTLEAADRVGDYRKVSEETWNLFCQLYPGSGPTITGTFPRAVKKTDPDSEGVAKSDASDDKAKGEKADSDAPKEVVDPFEKTGLYPTDSWDIGDYTVFKARTSALVALFSTVTTASKKMKNSKNKKASGGASKDQVPKSEEIKSLLSAPVGGANNTAAAAAKQKFGALMKDKSKKDPNAQEGMEMQSLDSKRTPQPKEDFYNDLYNKADSDDDTEELSNAWATSPAEGGL